MRNESTGSSFMLDSLRASRADSGRSYVEFLRVPALSVGLYVLAAGAADSQLPHTEDEVYLVTRGRARFRMNGEDVKVSSGSILYVQAGVPHHFREIEDELEVLVFFAPAEYTNRQASTP